MMGLVEVGPLSSRRMKEMLLGKDVSIGGLGREPAAFDRVTASRAAPPLL